ncbi:MAG: hypothetical protein OFPI_04900 [Osedax symbiont Rs2]|nr:MAG: hypothetical protein OFPI_04900 [Osedax symbiont Rs2]
MTEKTNSDIKRTQVLKKQRHPLMSATDINHILLHGAQISLSKLRRAGSHSARIFYFAEIGVYLEVSLSSGSAITDDAREQLAEIHQQALSSLMDANKRESQLK